MAAVNQVGNSLTGITGTGAFVGSTSPTISRPLINNTIVGYTTTATAASTTTLTVASNYQQFFTGATTQTVVMPVTSTLTIGQSWLIVNNSSGIVTVQSSGLDNIIAIPAGTNSIVTVIAQAGTTASDWNAEGVSGVAGVDSITGTSNQVIASASTGPVTLSLPQSIGTGSAVQFASINFGGTTLSTYTESTFTPQLRFGGSSTGITYTTQTGTYTRVGNIINFFINIVLSSKGAQTGDASIFGLPVAGVGNPVYSGYFTNLAFVHYPVFLLSSTTLFIRELVTTTAASNVQDTAFQNTTTLIINGSYSV